MEINHSREHLTPLGGDYNSPTTVCNVQLPDATDKLLPMLLTTRLNKNK